MQREWDEIVTIARGEALSKERCPRPLEEFIEDLRSGVVPTGASGGIGRETELLPLAECISFDRSKRQGAVLDYYGNPDNDGDLESPFEGLSGEDAPEDRKR